MISFEQLLQEIRENRCTNEVVNDYLEKNKFSDIKRFREFCEALKSNRTLSVLKLRNNRIGSEGTIALAEALAKNKTVTELEFSLNSILGSKCLDSNGVKALADLLKENSTLTTLDLSSNSICSNGTEVLIQALVINKTLTALDLSHINIGSKGIASLSSFLKHNTTITKLNLAGNELSGTDATALASALKENQTLVILNLEMNLLGCNGAKPLADLLTKNTTLKDLDLGRNDLNRTDIITLTDALKRNSTLERLNFGYIMQDKHAPEITQALSSMIEVNKGLTTLYITFPFKIKIAAALEKNHTLTSFNRFLDKNNKDDAQIIQLLERNKEIVLLKNQLHDIIKSDLLMLFNSAGPVGVILGYYDYVAEATSLVTILLHQYKSYIAKLNAETLKTEKNALIQTTSPQPTLLQFLAQHISDVAAEHRKSATTTPDSITETFSEFQSFTIEQLEQALELEQRDLAKINAELETLNAKINALPQATSTQPQQLTLQFSAQQSDAAARSQAETQPKQNSALGLGNK